MYYICIIIYFTMNIYEIDTYWIWWKGDFTVEESENRGTSFSGLSRVILFYFPLATENVRKGKQHWPEEGVTRERPVLPLASVPRGDGIFTFTLHYLYLISTSFMITSSDLTKERHIYLLGRHSYCCKHFATFFKYNKQTNNSRKYVNG